MGSSKVPNGVQKLRQKKPYCSAWRSLKTTEEKNSYKAVSKKNARTSVAKKWGWPALSSKETGAAGGEGVLQK